MCHGHGGTIDRSCSPSLRMGEGAARLSLLVALLLSYLLCGAAVFSALELDVELQSRQRWDERLAQFGRRHGVRPQALHGLLRHYEDAYGAGVRANPVSPRWDFTGAFYFTATVIATIGFGMTTPTTEAGKIFLIFYALIGCAATLLFLNLFLERVITLLARVMCWWRRRRLSCLGLTGGPEEGMPGGLRPSVYSVTLILGAMVVLVTCGASVLFSAMEGWGYLESVYFCFVAFSTIGFGDLVSSQRQGFWEAHGVYRLGSFLITLSGVCLLYSLYNVSSILIKQSLNWALRKLGLLALHPCASRPGPPHVGLCCCPPCFPRNLPPIDLCFGLHHGCNAVQPAPDPATPGRPQCANVMVDTVCRSEADVGGGHQFCGQMILSRDSCGAQKMSLAIVPKQEPEASSEDQSQQNGLLEGVGALAVMSNCLQETSTDR
ncbi:hypothetical protein JZ751_017124 [Albula glossodonta]|uniref:Potassium channel domain-containing protein n=1 Tax=Albula glossodonta TaxID=121402 RepID=A0A8T2NP44_9TELE|nr:hypothetical protein JZ751_017124 [Albula glossodonta]